MPAHSARETRRSPGTWTATNGNGRPRAPEPAGRRLPDGREGTDTPAGREPGTGGQGPDGPSRTIEGRGPSRRR